MNNKYTFTSTIWIYKGDSPWYFITLNESLSKEIKANLLFKPKGFGSIPIQATIGKTCWKTSIFPHQKSYYILPIKKLVRDLEDLNTTTPIKVTIMILI